MTSDKDSSGTVRWLEILELGAYDSDTGAPDDIQLMTAPGRVLFGVQPGPAEQSGIGIDEVVAGSAAESAGVKAGDVLLKFDNVATVSAAELRRMLRQKSEGDSFVATILRGDDELEIPGEFPAFSPEPVYRRDQQAAFADVRVTADNIDIRSHHVSRMRIWLPNEMADRSEVKVMHNGEEKSIAVQAIDATGLLRRFAVSADRVDNRFAFLIVD